MHRPLKPSSLSMFFLNEFQQLSWLAKEVPRLKHQTKRFGYVWVFVFWNTHLDRYSGCDPLPFSCGPIYPALKDAGCVECPLIQHKPFHLLRNYDQNHMFADCIASITVTPNAQAFTTETPSTHSQHPQIQDICKPQSAKLSPPLQNSRKKLRKTTIFLAI